MSNSKTQPYVALRCFENYFLEANEHIDIVLLSSCIAFQWCICCAALCCAMFAVYLMRQLCHSVCICAIYIIYIWSSFSHFASFVVVYRRKNGPHITAQHNPIQSNDSAERKTTQQKPKKKKTDYTLSLT